VQMRSIGEAHSKRKSRDRLKADEVQHRGQMHGAWEQQLEHGYTAFAWARCRRPPSSCSKVSSPISAIILAWAQPTNEFRSAPSGEDGQRAN
jgi:hypothetical protein